MFCKTHKHLVPGSVPSIFPQPVQSGGQTEISVKTIPMLKPLKIASVLKFKNKTFKPKQHKVKGESIAEVKNSKRCDIGNIGKTSNTAAHHDTIENGSAQIIAANTCVPNPNELLMPNNAITSETGNLNCSVSVKTMAGNNGNQTIVNPLTNAIGNRNLSYVGKVKIANTDEKLKNFKIFQCTVKPPEANNTNVVKPTNYVDLHGAYAEPYSITNRDTFSTKTGQKQDDTLNGSEVTVQDVLKQVFSNTEIRNLLLQNSTTSSNSTTVNVSDSGSHYIENNNGDCVASLNNHNSSLNESQSHSDNQSDKNDCTANHGSCSKVSENSNNDENNDSDCTIIYPNNYNSSLNVNDNSISTLPVDQSRRDIEKWRAVINSQIVDIMHSNNILRHQISVLKESIEKRRPEIKTRNDFLNQFNIEAMEEGIENKDVKSLFISDQLRSLTRDRILWSESSLEFMRRLIKKFPESYDFLEQADVMYMPNPRVLGCKKIKKC